MEYGRWGRKKRGGSVGCQRLYKTCTGNPNSLRMNLNDEEKNGGRDNAGNSFLLRNVARMGS